MDGLTRRRFLQRAAGGAAAFGVVPILQACGGDGDGDGGQGAATGAATTGEATGEALKIGFFTTLTGPSALNGIGLRNGWDMFVEERGGAIGGRPLEVVVEDDEFDPQVALTKVRKFVEQDQVDIVIGGVSAAAGPPVFEYVNEVEMPWINMLIAADDLTQRMAEQNRFMIRIGDTASQSTHPFGEWVYDELGYRNVVTIGWDMIFGYQLVGGFQRTFQDKGGAVYQKVWAPVGTPDFQPFLSQIPDDADAVFAAFAGGDAIRFLQQYSEFGLKERLPLMGNYTLTDEFAFGAEGMRAEHVLGIHTSNRFSVVREDPETREWVERYIAMFDEVPTNQMADGYNAGLFIEAALEKTGGDASDKGAFADAFVGLDLDTPRGPVRITDFRHPVANEYIREVQEVESPPVEGYDLPFMNALVETVEEVDQFWTYDPDEFMSQPPYGRDFPATKPRV